MLNRKKKSGDHLYLALFLYWLILLIWQNIRTAANRDGMDMVIKASLIVLLALYFLYNSQSVNRYVMIVFLLFVSIYAVTKLTAEEFSFDDAMFYFFPLLMFLLTLGMGGKCTVTKKQLTQLCYMLTFAVMYIVAYALIFQPEKYLEAITVTNAYGNELTSFLTSNHEFGYYLSFGVMAAILCLELDGRLNAGKKAYLITAIVLFSVSLILTFSRTAIVAFAVMLFFYVVFSRRKTMRKVLAFTMLGAMVVIILIPPLREYFLLIVFKNNNDAGREALIDAGMTMFWRGTLLNKLFGYGRQTAVKYLSDTFRHRSFHNSFVQALVCNGLVGLSFLIGCLVYEACNIYQTVRAAQQWKWLIKTFYGFLGALLVTMMFQTNDLFASSIDSYFLTFFTFVLPIYVNNAVRQGVFEADSVDAGPAIKET